MNRDQDHQSRATGEQLIDKSDRWGDFESVDMKAFNQAVDDGSLKIDFVNEDMAALFGKPLKVIDRK